MDCKHAQELLWAFCEGSLDRGATSSVEEHLGCCPVCRKERAEVEGTLRAMHAVGTIEPSADFHESLWQRIDAWEASRQALWLTLVAGFVRRNRRILATSCIAFGVALFGGLYILHNAFGPEATLTERTATGPEAARPEGTRSMVAMEGGAGQAPVRQDYIIRDIPYEGQFVTITRKDSPDTVYTRFPTRDLTPSRDLQPDNYIFEPVVTPVPASEPIF